ncbi:MAG: SRPBCC family protein [Nitrosospira sp.]|nr:SRPBCC family protein [Nitrosospira sp.]
MFGLLKDTRVVGKANALIQRPPKDIFDFVGANFLTNYPRWSPEVVELKPLTEGPVKVGTMCHQVRVDQGRRSESTFKVMAFQPSQRICFEGVSNPYRCDYILELATPSSASRITFTFELLSLDVFMRPFEKLIRIAVQEGTEKTVRNIKKLVETELSDNSAQT